MRLMKRLIAMIFVSIAIPIAASAQDTVASFTDQLTGMEFVWVSAGTFEMGCGDWAKRCDEWDQKLHSVTVAGFWIGKYEVTQGQWKMLMNTNPSKSNTGDNYPVDSVSGSDAMIFAQHMSISSKHKCRLPTEEEWEYAARSGGRPERYAGGNSIDSVAWHRTNSAGKTHEIGLKTPNGLGLYDMSGNVSEWTDDGGTEIWMARGGSWRSPEDYVRTAARECYFRDVRAQHLGFRVVCSQ